MNLEIIIGEIIAGIVGTIALLSINKLILGNKLLKESQKLSGQLSKFKQEFPEIASNSPKFVSDAIGDIGLDGVLDELGVPSAFKPLAKGFIDRIAQNPEMIKGIAEKFGVKLPDETNKTTSEYL